MDYWLQEALDHADKWISENKEYAEAFQRNNGWAEDND